jgi:hypothetical protein
MPDTPLTEAFEPIKEAMLESTVRTNAPHNPQSLTDMRILP